MVKGLNGPRFLWPGEVNQGGVVGIGGGFGWSTVLKWSGERSSSPLGSREGLHDPPIGGLGWVRQGFGWSRHKLVCSMVMSCRPQSNSSVGKTKTKQEVHNNRQYTNRMGNTTVHTTSYV